MPQHSTNYYNTLLTVAEDCPASTGEIPPTRGQKKSVANYQFGLLQEHPYQYTSDELLVKVHVLRKAIPLEEWEKAQESFFSKGQPCLRASPLTKRYGWGVHYNEEGKIALVAVDSPAYQDFVDNAALKKVAAMRSKKK